jgi:hypothetical protein
VSVDIDQAPAPPAPQRKPSSDQNTTVTAEKEHEVRRFQQRTDRVRQLGGVAGDPVGITDAELLIAIRDVRRGMHLRDQRCRERLVQPRSTKSVGHASDSRYRPRCGWHEPQRGGGMEDRDFSIHHPVAHLRLALNTVEASI